MFQKTHKLAQLDDQQEWFCNIETVFKHLKYPVVSMGIIKYCKQVTFDQSYFKVSFMIYLRSLEFILKPQK